MTEPRVSAVMTAYNAERYLGEALQGVLSQTRPVDEVIVVDDGSTDATAAIAGSFDPLVTVISGPNRGIGLARNTGLAAASGSVIALCDADDVWLPTKIEAQMDTLGADADQPVVVFCGLEEFVSPDVVDEYEGRLPRNDIDQPRVASTLLATRAAFDRVGLFTAHHLTWVEWCSRLADEIDDVRHVNEALARRRLHLHNTTLSGPSAKELAGPLAAHLRRRRGQA